MTHDSLFCRAILCAPCAVLFLTACAEARAPAEPPIDYHTSLQRASFRPTPLKRQGAAAPAGQQSEAVRVITESVLEQGTALFRKPGIESRLDAIEDAFLASKRYFALVALYKQDVDALGTATPAAPRYAWALIRLGQEEAARAMVERLETERPDDPIGPFMRGAMAMAGAKEEPERAAEVIANWERAIELDPDFVGPERVSAPVMEREIDALRAQHPALKPANAAAPTEPLVDPVEQAAEKTQLAHLSTADEPGALPTEEPAPLADPPPAPPRPAEAAPPTAPALIAQARAALDGGARGEAAALARRAIEAASGGGLAGLASSTALDASQKIDLLRLCAALNVEPKRVAAALGAIARSPGATTRQRFEAALVAMRTLKDPALAASILDALEAADAEKGGELPIDALRREIGAR